MTKVILCDFCLTKGKITVATRKYSSPHVDICDYCSADNKTKQITRIDLLNVLITSEAGRLKIMGKKDIN